ncbi:MAG: cysteine synthase A [Chloroflexi bacterium]|nr:cysteine synthase A [Chloroflexota bacterium]
MAVADDVLGLIGNTPMVRLSRLASEDAAAVFAKLESLNPAGSVKDRVALAMVEDAERRGLLHPGDTIVEPTSGNTGIGLAMVAAVKGYRLVLTMPEDMSAERQRLLGLFGAEVVLTPALQAMEGAVSAARKLASQHGYFMPQQFDNPANPRVHCEETGAEVLKAMNALGQQVDALVAGIGTGGTITGVAEALREANPDVLIVGVEPLRSAVLSGKQPGWHRIQGIGAGFVPKVLRRELIHEVLAVSDEDAFAMMRSLARREGLLVGPSSGAAAHAALQVAQRFGRGKSVIVILPDTGERYLSLLLSVK